MSNEDFDWLNANRERLLKTYGEKYITILNKEVVGVGNTPKEAFDNIKKDIKKRPLLSYLGNTDLGF
jgi:two-component SAPR family response regulator